MASAKSQDRAAAKKAKQEKILLGALAVLFVAVFFFFVLPKVTKKPVARASVPISTTSTTPGATGTGATATPAPTAAPSSGSFSMPSASYAGDSTHIGRLSKLQTKDPFAHSPVVQTTKASAPPAIAPRTVPLSTGHKTTKGSTTPGSTTPAGIPLYATISVNGASEVVTVGGQFPAASPLFVLKAAGPDWISFGLVNGTFATKAATVTLRVGRKLTLTNTADHSQFVLQLLRVDQQVPTTAATTTAQTDTGVLVGAATTPGSPSSGSTPPPPTAPTG